jgi:AAA family ATP:ADP antiporter
MSPETAAASVREARGPLEKLLAPFADARSGEAPTALLLMLDAFLLLTSYYILKPVREALILAGEGAEVKSYAAAGQVLILLAFVPAYGALAARVGRIRLITGVTLFFVACLVAFYLVANTRLPHLGLIFYIWIGIFNVAIIAQFWSYANDLYTPEAGKRLFAVIAFGSTFGAIVGASITKMLIVPLGVRQLMLVAGGVLLASIAILRIVDAREQRRTVDAASTAERPIGDKGGFELVLRDRYLLWIALLVLVLNIVNTNGEYILGKTLTQIAHDNVAAGLAGPLSVKQYEQRLIGDFYAGFQLTVNIVTAVAQLFLVSRIIQWFGVRIALLVMPVISLTGYSMLAFAPILGTVRLVKIAENATDYSLQNTTRQALFLPTSREAKYKAKAAIDTFFYRTGDLLSAGLVFFGAHHALSTRQFSLVNVVLVIFWLALALLIGRRYAALTSEGSSAKQHPRRR